MKKNYIYFVAPLTGLVVFSAVYWNYSSTLDVRIAAQKKKEHDETQAKLDKETEERLRAATDAKKAQDAQKAAKLAREKQEAEDNERRERAAQARNKAIREADKLAAQVKRLSKEIDDEKKEIAVIEEDKKRSLAEQVFLREYVKKAEDNARNLEAVLDKIAEADKQWEAAAREAARAAAAAKK